MNHVNLFKVGDKVKLREDVLKRHARSVPEQLGYTRAQFAWRNTLRALLGYDEKYAKVNPPAVGVVSRLFPGSTHVNVDFPGDVCIGINSTELESAGEN